MADLPASLEHPDLDWPRAAHARGGSVDECVALAQEAASRQGDGEGFEFVHPFDDPDVICGQAGVGIELAAQVSNLRRIVVPIGGGGLAAGTAMAVKLILPDVEVIGVQAAGCSAVRGSLDAGEPVALDTAETIADGIAVKRPGALTLPLLERAGKSGPRRTEGSTQLG